MYGYARVSTLEQNHDAQVDALRAAGVKLEHIYVEYASGAAHRAKLETLLSELEEGDVLIVTALDRLGRSLGDLVDIVSELGRRKVQFRCLREGFDTRNAAGRLLFHMAGAFAQYERDLIRERTRAGIRAARDRGVRIGRPRKLTLAKLREARELRRSGWTLTQIAAYVGCSLRTLRRSLALERAETQRRQLPLPGTGDEHGQR